MNHKLVPLSHKLQSGDQVEILTSKSQHVSPAWINFVSTAKAKAKIQAILRRDNRETQRAGEELLNEFLKKNNFEPSVALTDQLSEFHGYSKRGEFLLALGEKMVLLGEKDLDELTGKNKEEEDLGWRRRRKKRVPRNRISSSYPRSSTARSLSSFLRTTSTSISSWAAVTPSLATMPSAISTTRIR